MAKLNKLTIQDVLDAYPGRIIKFLDDFDSDMFYYNTHAAVILPASNRVYYFVKVKEEYKQMLNNGTLLKLASKYLIIKAKNIV